MTALYSIIQFLFWFAYGSSVNFASVYLLENGATNTLYGIVSSAACLLSIFLQPMIATYADKENSLSVKKLILIADGFLILCAVGLMAAFGKGRILNSLLMGACMLIVQILLPLINSLATETMNSGLKLNFSLARGIGSLGYAAMSFSLGFLIARLSVRTLPLVILAVTGLFTAAVVLFPFKNKASKTPDDRAVKKGDDNASGMFFKKYPVFAIALIGCSLVYAGHVYINSFVYQIVVSKGGNSEHMGVAMGIAGILEIVTMFSYSYLQKRKNAGFWMSFSGLFFTLKSLGTLLAGSIGAFYAVQIFQPLGWGLMTVSSVYYVNSIMEEADRIKGQAYMTMTLSVGTFLATLSGGILIDTIGVTGMLVVSIVCCAVGAAIITASIRKNHKGTNIHYTGNNGDDYTYPLDKRSI